MHGNLPAATCGQVDVERIPQEAGCALRDREVDDSSRAVEHPTEYAEGSECHDDVRGVPAPDVPVCPVVAGVEVLDVETVPQEGVAQNEVRRDRDPVIRRGGRADEEQLRHGGGGLDLAAPALGAPAGRD